MMKRPRVKRPMTRVEEIRLARGLSKAELARRSGMPPNTLQHIEVGKTKGLSVSARRILAPALQVRDDQLLQPVGVPLDPLPGEEAPIDDLIYQELQAIHATLGKLLSLLQGHFGPVDL